MSSDVHLLRLLARARDRILELETEVDLLCSERDNLLLDAEHATQPLPMPNGSLLLVPVTEAGEEFAMACSRAAVDARHEWERPRG